MTLSELIELLARAEHASWARWMAWVFLLCTSNEDGSLTIPADLVERWKKQIYTDYNDLTPREQKLDRDEVEHIIPHIQAYAAQFKQPLDIAP